LLLAGRDQDRIQGRLRTQAKELGIARHVRWLGERRQVADLLRASDIGLLCSHEEGLSNSVLEGMAAGLPMIATSVGGNPEAVQHGLTGLLVPPRDSNVLGNAILELANDPDKRRAMGAAGRNRVADCFSLQACVARYEALYRALLAGDSRPIAEILGYGAGDRLQGA
jgi:glycosyltransferase involved in cell wall biosynthesis